MWLSVLLGRFLRAVTLPPGTRGRKIPAPAMAARGRLCPHGQFRVFPHIWLRCRLWMRLLRMLFMTGAFRELF